MILLDCAIVYSVISFVDSIISPQQKSCYFEYDGNGKLLSTFDMDIIF